MRRITPWLLAFVAAAGAARAEPPLERVESPVYEAPGSPADLARRANTCAAQLLTSGLVTAPPVLSADFQTGVVVARNAFLLAERSRGMTISTPARTRMTFEARDGRFRITFSDLQVQLFRGTWQGMPRPDRGGAAFTEQMKAELLAQADGFAACVREQQDDW